MDELLVASITYSINMNPNVSGCYKLYFKNNFDAPELKKHWMKCWVYQLKLSRENEPIYKRNI